MTRFVDECRSEWRRLGVPAAEANEMAADLEVDLAEAEADGASPEEVLGQGYFDARSFAASWALARGFARPARRGYSSVTVRVRSLVLGLSALVGAVLALAGLIILVQPGFGAQSFAAAVRVRNVRQAPIAVLPPGPHTFAIAGLQPGLDPVGWVLLVVGLVALAVVFALWRPWSSRRGGSGIDENVGMPSLL